MKGVIAVIALGLAFLAFSVVAITVPRPVLLRTADFADHHIEALIDAGGSAVQRVVDAGKNLLRKPRRPAQGQAPRRVEPELSGRVRVVDGDTLELGAHRIRLHGVDAPESAQTCRTGATRWPCGERATRALAERIGGRAVACEKKDQDRYGRIVALCRLGAEDLNAWLVARGWALAYRRYSTDYVDEETAASAARRGIWRGDFVPPWDWRRGERLRNAAIESSQNTHSSAGNCRIKGNIGRNGTRIYHVPGGEYYEPTRINTAKGERWFCSESEARAAGWRRAKR